MAKTAIFLANGFEEIEGLTVVDILRRAQIDITMVSITGAKAVEGSHGIKLEADATIESFDLSDVDMIILPGGMPGTKNLDACEPLKAKIKEFNDSGKMLAAICAAPTVYGKMGLLNGKKACCYPGCEGDLLGATTTTDAVIKDGNFITSRGMGTAIPFALAILEHFKGKEAADQMAKGIVFNS
ncbi:DJ-1/PfpI family protein [Butyrivibrio sp. X503]|uniref:DJ-1 family glyoxalase III n=1 Tax=Butyrivibrio sp. X503 TaxID=2364878 RepID=UPI000EA8DDD5|nr:DJ-1 family glyoxalase III [Butyrivibrio sp. X503]RKM58238.1 DJ-1/PfpI family protein [Butyrivibrio sp. X503]